MNEFADWATAVRAVADPNTSAEALARIAEAQPGLGPQVAMHPNAYPSLLDWLAAGGDPATQAAVAQRRNQYQQPAYQYQQPAYQYQQSPATKPGSFGWAVLAFLVPVVGLVLWLVWRRDRPGDSKMSRNGFIVGIALAVVMSAIGTVAFGLLLRERSAPPPFNTTQVFPPPPDTQVVPPDANAQHAWITVPSTETKPDALIVDIHFDYQCPYCGMLERAYGETFKSLSDTGDIVLRLHTRTFLDPALQNDSSTRAAIAAACVDVADGSLYAAYSNEIFNNQPSSEGSGFSDQDLTQTFTAAVGLTGRALDTFNTCYAERQTASFVTDMEANNIAAVVNDSPPNGYLFGGNVPNIDTGGYCTGTAGAEVGTCGTPDFYVQGVQFSLIDLFNSDETPRVDPSAPSALLRLLQTIAGS